MHVVNFKVYHALQDKWKPKSIHFSYHGMNARSQLEVMDFNSGSDLEQETTKDGTSITTITGKGYTY